MKTKQAFNKLFLSIGILLCFMACTPTRKLQTGEYMLTKNKVIADKKEIPVDDIMYVIRPTPNKKFLNLFFWKAGIYQAMTPNDTTNDNKAKQWMRKNFGEPLVLLDTALIEYSNSQIHLFMKNKGYFESNVSYKIKTKRKKAKVNYYIEAGQACKIADITYKIKDDVIYDLIMKDTINGLLKVGSNFDVDEFANERNRISSYLNNHGYFNFTENYIIFKIDSNLTDYTVKVSVEINNPTLTQNDSIIAAKHRRYFIKDITIHTDINNTPFRRDTIYYTEIVNKTDTNHYRLLYHDKVKYKPKSLVFP